MTTNRKRQSRYWGELPVPTSKAEFFNAVTTPTPTGDASIATIRMYGPIDSYGGYWGISTSDISGVLDALPDSVTQIILRINSPGGEVFEGIAILNLLRAHRATVTAVVDGLAASAASVIAAGCDEVVMSPGTQMMIHSPSSIVWGNAVEMRKTADTLDRIEVSLIEVYVAKAGEKEWAALLAEETWLPAADAVELGLADRVGVVADAGETATAGEEEIISIPDDDEPEDSAAARVVRIAARVRAAAPERPVSPEPGTSNRKENVVTHDDFVAGIRERLGVTDAAATDETVLAALDEALAETAETPAVVISDVAAVPEGAIVMDAAQHAQLVSDAAAGREAREEQISARRDRVVLDAIRDGRIAPASRDQWRNALEENEENITKLLASFPTNKAVPTQELGRSDDITDADDALYNAMCGTNTEGA